MFESHVFYWKLDFWCCVDWAFGSCYDQCVIDMCLCSSWAWGGKVGGLWLRIWLRRCQGWRWWERIWVRKRELLAWRMCIRTLKRRLILNCFSRWVLFCNLDLLIICSGINLLRVVDLLAFSKFDIYILHYASPFSFSFFFIWSITVLFFANLKSFQYHWNRRRICELKQVFSVALEPRWWSKISRLI